MNVVNKQELQIVQAFSSIDLPEKIIRDSNLTELIHGMTTEQSAIQSDAQRLDRLRQQKKDANFVANWWNDQDDLVQDAHIDLNKSVGRLAQKSSQLLIVNTAISKVLNDQQRILLEQQDLLTQQADKLEDQNGKILEQQKLLEKQQKDINAANQGLMEAKGITQEQAQKLVGCVVRVTDAEKKIGIANEELLSTLDQRLHDGIEKCVDRLNAGLSELGHSQEAVKQEFLNLLSVQSHHGTEQLRQFQEDITSALERAKLAQDEAVKTVENKFTYAQQDQEKAIEAQRESSGRSQQRVEDALNRNAESLKALESQLANLRAEQQKHASRNRRALAFAVCLALSSISWIIAQRFSMFS